MKWYHRLDVQLTLMFLGVLTTVVSLTAWIHHRGTIINLVGPFHEYREKLEQAQPRLEDLGEGEADFDRLLAELKSAGDLLMIVDRRFNVYAHTTPGNSHVELVRMEADEDYMVVVTSSVAQKLDYILLYRQVPFLQFVHGDEVYYLVIMPEPWIIDPPEMTPILFDGLRNHFDIYGWLYAGVILFFVFFIRRRLRPLRHMEGAAQRLSLREIPEPVAVGIKGDEVGQLVEAFNTALARLNENETMRRRMVSDIAHELRTPLTALSGRLEAYGDGLIDDAGELIQFTGTQVVGLTRIVEDLALLSSSDAGELALNPEPMKPRAVLEGLLQSAGAGDRFHWSIEGDDPTLNLDPQRFGQILLQLISNAERAKPRDLVIRLVIEADDQWVKLNFEDNGPGVSPADLPRLFDRLYRTDAGRSSDMGGSGLGLSIVKSLVEAQGGKVRGYLVADGGLGLEIRFPRQSRDA